jgi:hypothetical protein
MDCGRKDPLREVDELLIDLAQGVAACGSELSRTVRRSSAPAPESAHRGATGAPAAPELRQAMDLSQRAAKTAVVHKRSRHPWKGGLRDAYAASKDD